MRIQETADFLPIGEIALTEEQLKEFLELGVCVIDENENENEEEIPNE